MKLFICTIYALLCLGVYATPAEDEARLKIKGSFKVAEAIVEEVLGDLHSKLPDHWLLAVRPLVKSIDQECVFEKYKNFDMFDELLTEEEVVVKIQETIKDPTKEKRITRLAVIGVTCSSKITPILKFIFDNLAATAELAYAFREDPPLNEYYEQLRCYGHYAIGHNIVDPAQHSDFKPTALVNQTQDECYQTIEQYIFMVSMIIDSERSPDAIEAAHRECIANELLGFAKKLLFTINVLLQEEVPESEKAVERKLFFNDFNNAIEKIVFCESSVKKKASG